MPRPTHTKLVVFFKIVICCFYLFQHQGLHAMDLDSKLSADELKAVLIVQICENVIWSRQLPDTIEVACFDRDDKVYQVLSEASRKYQIQNKPFRVKNISEKSDLSDCQILYVEDSDFIYEHSLFNMAQDGSFLLISDGIKEELLTYINIKESDEKISFSVNVPNLSLAGFSLKPNLLLAGGKTVDIKKAYADYEEMVSRSKRNLKFTKEALFQSELLLNKRDSVIAKRNLAIQESFIHIDLLKQESLRLKEQLEKDRALLKLEKQALSTKEQMLAKISSNIEEKQKQLLVLHRNLDELRSESEALKKEIEDKNKLVSTQMVFISNQQQKLLLSIGLIAALMVIGTIVMRLLFLKRRLNTELEHKVQERTLELQNKNDQYLSLFNLAPVPIWELDLSKVKLRIKECGIQSEEDFDAYVLDNPHFGYECFKNMRFLNINAAALELFKIKHANEIQNVYHQMHQSNLLSILANEYKAILLNQKMHSYEAVRLNAEGTKLNLLIKCIDISDNADGYSRVLMTLVDVTRIRSIEEELRKHKGQLELLVSERTEKIKSLNKELLVQNDKLYNNKKALEISHHKMQIANEKLEKQKAELHEAYHELKEAQVRILHAEKMSSLGILTAGVAHEINNPLNFIQSGLYAMEVVLAEESMSEEILKDVTKVMGDMDMGVKRASAIVKSLSTFSRKDNQTIKRCDIHQIIENSLLILNHEIKNKVLVNKEFSKEAFIFEGNEEGLHQVFINVLMNAVQAIDNTGGITVRTCLVNKENLELRVIDNGQGINPEDMSKVFDPFFTTKAPGEGVGLGLSIVYRIVKEHKGSIVYNSTPQKGTEVIINLPIKRL